MKKKTKIAYGKVLLKITGEVFESAKYDLDAKAVWSIVKEIKTVYDLEVKIAIVVGAGNIVRGAGLAENKFFTISRTRADKIGMIATLTNADFLRSALISANMSAETYSAVDVGVCAKTFDSDSVFNDLENGIITIFAYGTGNPFVTTDTAAVIRACQIESDALLKCTHVPGIYSADPQKYNKAKFIKSIRYAEVVKRQLEFMDKFALGLAMENFKKPIHVFDIFKESNLRKVVCGGQVGSVVY